MINEGQSKVVNDQKDALQLAAVEAVLKGTTWHSVERGEVLPRRCSSLMPSQLAQLLFDGALFSISVGGRRLVPDYAFDPTGNVFHAISELVQLFAESSMLNLASWMESRNSFLDGRRPREVLEMQPQLVILAARAHLLGPMHG